MRIVLYNKISKLRGIVFLRKAICIFVFTMGVTNYGYCQFGSEYKLVENRKEIKTYKNGILETKTQFDRRGNLIFYQTFIEDELVAAIEYTDYDENDIVQMIISASTIGGISIYNYEYLEDNTVKYYVLKDRSIRVYDPCVKKFLQKATSITALLDHKEVKNLLKTQKETIAYNYKSRSTKGEVKTEITINSHGDTTKIEKFIYDKKGREIEKKVESKYGISLMRSIYDESNNLIENVIYQSKDTLGKKNWVIDKVRSFEYNDKNQKVARYRLKGTGKTLEAKFIYDEYNRKKKITYYNEEGSKDYEYLYEYEDGLLKSYSTIHYNGVKEGEPIKSKIKTFVIELYDE